MNIDQEIEGCVKYLLEAQKDDESFAAAGFYDTAGFLAKLDSVERDLVSAVTHLSGIRNRLDLEKYSQFTLQSKRVSSALASALTSLATVKHTQQSVKNERPQVTRSNYYQKSAARLAFGIVGDRVRGEARAVALKIMDKAGLMPPPETSTLTKWLGEFKGEDKNVK